MKTAMVSAAIAVSLTLAGCARENAGFEVKAGTDVTLQKRDGVAVTGRLVEVKGDQVIIESREGVKTQIPRSEIQSLRANTVAGGRAENVAAQPQTGGNRASAEKTADSPGLLKRVLDRGPEYREVVVPAGTTLPVELQSTVGSATSKVEDRVRGTLRHSVNVNGVTAIPAGTAVLGHVTSATRSGRVKGRAEVAFRFTELDLPGESDRVSIRTSAITRVAEGTKKRDAAEIGGGAAGGAILGGILGGGGGAKKGAVIGGAAGTGVVLSTRGKEVVVGSGTPLAVRLTAPVTLRIAVK